MSRSCEAPVASNPKPEQVIVPSPINVTKALVMAKTKEENVLWAYDLIPE